MKHILVTLSLVFLASCSGGSQFNGTEVLRSAVTSQTSAEQNQQQQNTSAVQSFVANNNIQPNILNKPVTPVKPETCPAFIKDPAATSFSVSCSNSKQSLGRGETVAPMCCSVRGASANLEKLNFTFSGDCDGSLQVAGPKGIVTGSMKTNSCAGNIVASDGIKTASAPVKLYSRFDSLPQGLPGYSGLPSKIINAVYFDEESKTLFVGSGNGLSFSKDDGKTYVTKTVPDGLVDNAINNIVSLGQTVYAASAFGLAKSVNGGTSFEPLNVPQGGTVAAKGNDVFFVSISTGLYISSDGGKTFSQPSASSNFPNYYPSAPSYDGETLVVPTWSGLALSKDKGKTFKIINSQNGLASDKVTSAKVSSLNIIVGYGDSGKVSVSKDGGLTWITQLLADLPPGNSVLNTFILGNKFFISIWGNGGGLFMSQDFGQTFTRKDTTSGLGHTTTYSIAATGSKVFLGTYEGLSISENHGVSFSTFVPEKGLLGSYISALATGPDGTLYVSAVNSAHQMSTDGGATFAQMKTHPSIGIWKMFLDGNKFYTGYSYLGGIAFSTNKGDTFTHSKVAQGLGADCVYDLFAKGSKVYVATNNSYYCSTQPGGVSISNDGGVSFTNRTVENSGLVSNAALAVTYADNVLWVGTEHGLSYSTNEGQSFLTKTTADGLGHNYINVIRVVDGVVYVGTSGGLSISTDGGKTFVNRTTSDGLGDAQVSDVLVIGKDVYVGTNWGLAISHDSGKTFLNHDISNGLGAMSVGRLAYDGTNIYVGHFGSGGLVRSR